MSLRTTAIFGGLLLFLYKINVMSYNIILGISEGCFNSFLPRAVYMRRWTGSALVQVIITWNNTAKLSIGQFGTNFSETGIEIKNFSLVKMRLKLSSVKRRPFCSAGDELILSCYRWRKWSLVVKRNFPCKQLHIFPYAHDDVIKWKHFPRNWPFVRGIHRSRWIPHTKASDAELWCFLWSASE